MVSFLPFLNSQESITDVIESLREHAQKLSNMNVVDAKKIGLYEKDIMMILLDEKILNEDRLNIIDRTVFRVLQKRFDRDYNKKLVEDNLSQLYLCTILFGPVMGWDRITGPLRFKWSRGATDISKRIVSSTGGIEVKRRLYHFLENNLVYEAGKSEAEYVLSGKNSGYRDLSYRLEMMRDIASELKIEVVYREYLLRYVQMSGSYISEMVKSQGADVGVGVDFVLKIFGDMGGDVSIMRLALKVE
ncbi:MAG: hypothetical protein HRU15_18060 [Planctomycetes bacterium]|nr:hypothetical protein [Planctomycetota bacterium]